MLQVSRSLIVVAPTQDHFAALNRYRFVSRPYLDHAALCEKLGRGLGRLFQPVSPAEVPLSRSMNTRPTSACANCWGAWLHARPRKALGYCWHGYVAWRVRSSGELITAAGVDPAEHLTMIRALQEREPQGFAAVS